MGLDEGTIQPVQSGLMPPRHTVAVQRFLWVAATHLIGLAAAAAACLPERTAIPTTYM